MNTPARRTQPLSRFGGLFLALLAASGNAATTRIEQPGEMHGDESIARDGETWLALMVEGDQARLVSGRVRVEAVNDAVLDGPDDATGARVSMPALAGEPLMFLQGAALREGAVTAANIDARARPDVDQPLALSIPGDLVLLGVTCPAISDEAHPDCTAYVQRGAQRQELARFPNLRDETGHVHPAEDVGPTVLFAGDLDHDGRIDLLLDTTDHYNATQPTLFLSGAAQRGELVREVAKQRMTGC